MLVSITVTAFAVSSAEVYADSVTATADKTILIPVRIKNNQGIMGFKITVDYDESVLSSPKVTKGDVTENGMMNDSIGVTKEGLFDVVWSGTQNFIGDGTLMILNFTPLKSEDTQIKLTYSQADTFNEVWEDVELKCSDITVKFLGDTVITETVTSQNQSQITPDSEEIKNTVDIVLGEINKGNIDEIADEEKGDFVDRTNEILNQLTGGVNKPFESVDEIKDAYGNAVKDEFVDEVLNAVDSDKTEEIINNALSAIDAESIEKIPPEKREDFIQRVESGITQYAPDVDSISDKLTADEALEAIKELQGENKIASTEGKKLPDVQSKNNTVIAITVAAVILIAAIIAVTVVYMKRRKNKEEKTNEENI